MNINILSQQVSAFIRNDHPFLNQPFRNFLTVLNSETHHNNVLSAKVLFDFIKILCQYHTFFSCYSESQRLQIDVWFNQIAEIIGISTITEEAKNLIEKLYLIISRNDNIPQLVQKYRNVNRRFETLLNNSNNYLIIGIALNRLQKNLDDFVNIVNILCSSSNYLDNQTIITAINEADDFKNLEALFTSLELLNQLSIQTEIKISCRDNMLKVPYKGLTLHYFFEQALYSNSDLRLKYLLSELSNPIFDWSSFSNNIDSTFKKLDIIDCFNSDVCTTKIRNAVQNPLIANKLEQLSHLISAFKCGIRFEGTGNSTAKRINRLTFILFHTTIENPTWNPDFLALYVNRVTNPGRTPVAFNEKSVYTLIYLGKSPHLYRSVGLFNTVMEISKTADPYNIDQILNELIKNETYDSITEVIKQKLVPASGGDVNQQRIQDCYSIILTTAGFKLGLGQELGFDRPFVAEIFLLITAFSLPNAQLLDHEVRYIAEIADLRLVNIDRKLNQPSICLLNN